MSDEHPGPHQDPHALLRDRLRRSDPAASLPAADPSGSARLLEDVMSTELTTENRATGTRNRGPLTWLVAAAAVLIIAGVGVFAVVSHDSDPAPPPTAGDARTVTELAAPGSAAYRARCMVPDAQALSSQAIAFDGTVTTLGEDAVTLSVNHWYAGSATDLVRVRAPAQQLRELVGAVTFRDGGRYLVSATNGEVTVCGFTAPWSQERERLYQQAFGD